MMVAAAIFLIALILNWEIFISFFINGCQRSVKSMINFDIVKMAKILSSKWGRINLSGGIS